MPKRSQLPLTALRAFEAFARLGKMSLAADELCVTHGAVSRQVRSLEAVCGVKLTQGPRNALKLTDAGERMARSLGHTFDQLEETFREVRSAGERELHVSCVGTLANIFAQELEGSFPQYHVGTSEEILTASGGQAETVVLMLHIDFVLEKHQIHGYVAFILDLTALHDLREQVDRYLTKMMGSA